ncbi:MAG: hypothetical protein Q7T37_01810 [bacterium]|nr:hypothetical protein [bacterium]MDO8742767.1 hypothetical protein [bacterium]
MSWAARRRFIILFIIGMAAFGFLTVVLTATFYKAPSCADFAQNQDEEGIDCGGSCPYLCMAQMQPPTVLFTKALTNSVGRTDVIALVENKNASAAAKDVPYRISLYGTDRLLLQEVTGTLDLPPGATEPVYVPGVASGKQKVGSAFLSIDSSFLRWFSVATDSRIVPSVSNTKQGGTTSSPRIDAILANPSVIDMNNVQVVVLVRDARGEVIASSGTVVQSIPAQGQATATFTWNNEFPGVPASIEVVPIISLP